MHKLFNIHIKILTYSQIHSRQCECLCTVQVYNVRTRTACSLLNTGMARKKQILLRALEKGVSVERFFRDSAGWHTKAFDMWMDMVLGALEKYTVD